MKAVSIAMAVILILSLPTTGSAKWWVTPGLGGSNSGFALGASISGTAGSLVFSGRYLKTFSEGFIVLEKEESEVGLLIGYHTENAGEGLLSASIGVGYVEGVDHSILPILTSFGTLKEERRPFSGPAFLMQAEACTAIGFGLLLFGDLNSDESFGGALLVWRFGSKL